MGKGVDFVFVNVYDIYICFYRNLLEKENLFINMGKIMFIGKETTLVFPLSIYGFVKLMAKQISVKILIAKIHVDDLNGRC